MRKLLFLFQLLIPLGISAKVVVNDTPDVEMHRLFSAGKAKYVISYNHTFSDIISIPYGSIIMFDGGSLKGPIKFNQTSLKGKVRLKGSSISGHITNKIFNASWLCAMDGITDDAPRINEMIDVCGNVFFPKGNYRLISAFNPEGKLPKELHSSVNGHIAINKSNVTLEGETGTTFITDEPLITLSVFSQPNDIVHSISNVKIQNITFEVHNDGKNFHEFMHTIKVIGINGLLIEGCTFKDFWGDAICLSHYGDTPGTGERTRNQNVKILNSTIVGGDHHSNRNGISVINGKNILIKGNTIKNTSRKDMPGGIDVEPNNSAYTIENIRIENNILESIQGSVGAIAIVSYSDGPAHNISIIGNRINNSRTGIHVYIKTNNTTDNFVIKNNTVSDVARPIVFTGNGKSKDWIISGNTFERPCLQEIPGDIRVDNLVVKNNKKKE